MSCPLMAELALPVEILPADSPPGPRRELFAALARIDGWGELAWRETMGAWRVRGGALVLERREGDDDPACTLIADPGAVPAARDVGDAAAIADWALRRCWSDLLARCPIRATADVPGTAVRALSGCHLDHGRLVVRLLVRLPFAGMCVDGTRFARFVRRCESFLGGLAPDRELRDLRAAVAVQRALRAALPTLGLIGFVGEGALLARGADGSPAPGCRPLRVPRELAVTVDLGRHGKLRGLGIRRGITVVTGAPYHGKSTLVQALAQGHEDHRPGDGRERVVADPSLLTVRAEDGRAIKSQDLRAFFAALPGGDVRAFTTARASGATSMAASVLQGIAAGSRLLLIDEDAAAGNFLAIEPAMRQLLGRALAGSTTLLEALPALSAAGTSAVLAVGSSTRAFACADQVILLDRFQPRLVTARARRLAGGRIGARGPVVVPGRRLVTTSDALLGERHFLRVDAREPERPRLYFDARSVVLDLRRSGWELDEAVVRGALAGAAWCLRLARGKRLSVSELGARLRAHLDTHGPRGLDPFDTAFLATPPWQLVVTVLERLPSIDLISESP